MKERHQIAVLYAKPGREAVLRENLAALVAPSRAEEGNLRYDLYGDVADPCRFIFIETWASEEAQRRHHEHAPHIRHFHANGDADVERRESFYVIDPIA
jgi:quinol monooxygenase YgiN